MSTLNHLITYSTRLPYNGTSKTGGNSLTDDLNIFYDVSYPAPLVSLLTRLYVCLLVVKILIAPQAGDIAWILMSTALVLLMIPGVG